MEYRKNYKRRSILSRKIIASGLSAAFCVSTVGGSYAGAMDFVIEDQPKSQSEKENKKTYWQIFKEEKSPKIAIAVGFIVIIIILFCVFFIPYAKEQKKLKNQSNGAQDNKDQGKDKKNVDNVPAREPDKSQNFFGDSKAFQALKFVLLTAIGGGTGVASFHEINKHLINGKTKKILTESNNKSDKTKIESELADTGFNDIEGNDEKSEHSTKMDVVKPIVPEKNAANEKAEIEKTNCDNNSESESNIKSLENVEIKADFEETEQVKAENNNTVKDENKTSANIEGKEKNVG